MNLRVLGVSSSTRENSFSATGLKIALEKIKENGGEIELLDFTRLNL